MTTIVLLIVILALLATAYSVLPVLTNPLLIVSAIVLIVGLLLGRKD